MRQQNLTQVSVIVPVRDGYEHLVELLAGLRLQTFPRDRFEVVIGDDGSTDRRHFELAKSDGWVRVVAGPATNSYAARNRAVGVSRGPVLAFCDADCRPEPTWIESGLAALATCDIVAGRIVYRPPAKPTVWTAIDMETGKDHARLVTDAVAETANLFVRRELFDRLGGFDASIAEGGDFDLVERAVRGGALLRYAAEPVVTHPTRDDARGFLRAIYIYSQGWAERKQRDGELPFGLRARNWIPVLPTVISRRRYGMSVLSPDPANLARSGATPRTVDKLLAPVITYLVVPYVRNVGQVSGWLRARRRYSR
jgi:glycosyltransferase involved in cell wall biosynthesis